MTIHNLKVKTKTQLLRMGAAVSLAVLIHMCFPQVVAVAPAVQPRLEFALSNGPVLAAPSDDFDDALVQAVQEYLERKNSPLAAYAPLIVKQERWQMALAVISVESTFCRFAKNYNCGSVGVAPGHPQWRKFTNHGDGFLATAQLLEKPLYKDRLNTCKKMIGVYVVPGTSKWKNGCEKTFNDLVALTESVAVNQDTQTVALQNTADNLLAVR